MALETLEVDSGFLFVPRLVRLNDVLDAKALWVFCLLPSEVYVEAALIATVPARISDLCQKIIAPLAFCCVPIHKMRALFVFFAPQRS